MTRASRGVPRTGGRGDDGASEIVGNILMIGVTVLLAGGLAVSLSTIPRPEDPVSADLVVDDDAKLTVRHAGGEPVPVREGTFVLTVDGTEQVRPLSDFAADVSAGNADLWEIGEEVCLSCQVTGTIESVNVVAREDTLLSWERVP